MGAACCGEREKATPGEKAKTYLEDGRTSETPAIKEEKSLYGSVANTTKVDEVSETTLTETERKQINQEKPRQEQQKGARSSSQPRSSGASLA